MLKLVENHAWRKLINCSRRGTDFPWVRWSGIGFAEWSPGIFCVSLYTGSFLLCQCVVPYSSSQDFSSGLIKNKCMLPCREMRGWECGNFWHLKFCFSVQILERDFYSVAKRLSRPNSNHWNISLCGWVASCTFNQMRGLCDSPKALLQSPAKGTQFLWWPHLGYFSEKQRPFLAHCVFERNSMKLKRCHMASQVLWYAWTILPALLMWSGQRSGGALHAVLPLWIVPRWPVPSDHPDRWMNSSRSLCRMET